jgi:phosphoglucomutase
LREGDTPPQLILVGYDTRMLSEKFARTAAKLIAGCRVRAELPPRDIPSPVLSSGVLERGADAGITFTGSHNPPEYSGLKLYTREGFLAPRALTDRVEARYRELEPDFDDVYVPHADLVGSFDPKPAYLRRLAELIDWKAIRASGLKLVVDPLYGTTREYLDHILLENDVEVTVIRNTRDPYFGGYAPDCTSDNLSRLRDVMRRTGAHLGLATDGDGDRFGALDQGARMADSSQAIALILDYLARRRGLEGGVGRSFATSSLIDAVAKSHGLEVLETPVGFRSVGPLLKDGTLEFAGEESAGLAWSRHLPERDGILALLLLTEMVAVEGKSLFDLNHELTARVGTFAFRRTQVPTTEQGRQLLQRRVAQEWRELEGRRVVAADRTDGLKLTFDNGSWILLRESGTEPKIRLYAEGRSNEEMRHLMHIARRLLTNWRL